MSSPFSKPSEYVGGKFFKPADHSADLAILFEPKSIQKDQPSKYGPRDIITTDVTVFGTEESLETGVPTAVLQNARLDKKMIVGTLERVIDGAMVSIVRKITLEGGNEGWVLRDVDDKAEKQVASYYEKREAEVQDNLDSAPGFD